MIVGRNKQGWSNSSIGNQTMSWWRRLLNLKPPEKPYGLHADNPVLCGGGVASEIDYLRRLRCPAGSSASFERQGSLGRTDITYLDRLDVTLQVSRGTLRRLGDFDPIQLPLDAYFVVCDCRKHYQQIYIDMYFRGPEMPIGDPGWTLINSISPAESVADTAPCPNCAQPLRTPRAKQCPHCKLDWHDPENVRRFG
jgi:hypothetical protein